MWSNVFWHSSVHLSLACFLVMATSGSESFAALDRLFPLNQMPSESEPPTHKRKKKKWKKKCQKYYILRFLFVLIWNIQNKILAGIKESSKLLLRILFVLVWNAQNFFGGCKHIFDFFKNKTLIFIWNVCKKIEQKIYLKTIINIIFFCTFFV